MQMKELKIINIMIGINVVLSRQYFKQEYACISYRLNGVVHEMDTILVEGNDTVQDILQRIGFSDTTYESSLDGLNVKVLGDKLQFTYQSQEVKVETNLELFGEYRIDTDRIKKTIILISKQIRMEKDKKISEYVYLSEEEKNKILWGFKGDEKKIDSNVTVITYLERFASEKGNKIAITFGNKNITYSELNESANIVAHNLIRNGIKRDDVVGLVMERSDKFIVICLALWKIGAAYMPIAFELPAQRLNEIVNETTPALLVVEDLGLYNRLNASCKVVYVKELMDELGPDFKENLNIELSGDTLAYVINTSGSTGIPKGVMIEQLGLMNHIYAILSELGIEEKTVIAQTAAISFDISVWQMFAAFVVGARVVVIPQADILDVFEFVEIVKREQVTELEIVPSYLKILFECVLEDEPNYFNDLKNMIITGENADTTLINKWFSIYVDKILINAYGPAEASDDVTFERFTGKCHGNVVSVGNVIQNMSIYILDEQKQLCPIGIPGEMYIAGIGLARGYRNDEEKTKSAFIWHKIGDTEIRLYKSGDYGRWREDGSIEFLGRRDEQIKIYGYRIELNEIKSVLMQHVAIMDAAVLCALQETKELVAFVVLAKKISVEQLREYLENRLPYYMVPNRILFIEKMPLTENGKVDRKKLLKYSESN